MDPQTVFCYNPACPASGQVGKGNIGVHSVQERRYICHVCGKTFTETKGTLFYRLRTAKDVVLLVVTLLACGCPVQAIVVAVGLDEHTALGWQARAEQHCQRVHEHLMERPRARITALIRRGRALARRTITLHDVMYLVGTVYNFCAYHKSLRLPLYLSSERRRWLPRTPAIAAGLTGHLWTAQELLPFRVPPPLWKPPRRRGHCANAVKSLVAQWCT